MLRNGKYTVIDGCLYRFAFKKNKYSLISRDPLDEKKGFIDIGDGFYKKEIKKEELKECYRIDHTAIFNGNEFGFRDLGNNQLELACADMTEAEKYGFYRSDKYMWSKIVLLSEVEIKEYKTPYTLK